jgi:predicted GNAT family acetyltransferase
MIIEQDDNTKNGRFFIQENGTVLAEMTYVWAGPSRIIIDHTEVSEVLKGKSAGKLLLTKAVSFARDKSIKIMPLCPFAKSVFDKTPDYADVLF